MGRARRWPRSDTGPARRARSRSRSRSGSALDPAPGRRYADGPTNGQEGTILRSTGEPKPQLRGRRTQTDALDRLVSRARGGTSGAVALRGEAGIGKTALLDYLADH